MNENEIQVWNYESSEIRTVQINGEPWFVLSDVCKVLELSSPHKVAERLDGDEKGRNQIPTLGGVQEMAVVNESGLYTVILRSDKPQAKPFRKWVTSVVLPSIRKTGSYSVQQPNAFENLSPQLQVLIQMETRQKQIEARQAEQATISEMGHLRSASIHPQARQLFRAVAVCRFIPTVASSDSDGNPSETDRSPSGRAGNRTCRAGTEVAEYLRGHRSGQDRMEKRQRTPD